MSFQLHIATVTFQFSETSFGRAKAIRQLKASIESMIDDIFNDICLLINALNNNEIVDIDASIINPITRFLDQVQQLPQIKSKLILQKQIRFFALVIKNRINKIPLDSHGKINALLENIKNAVGQVPELNLGLELPPEDFLPIQFVVSKEAWQRTPYLFPGRSSEDKVSFFDRSDNLGKISSVRRYLLSLEMNSQNPSEAISYADADFYSVGDLQVDHLQASEDIIARQLELIEAINLDPLFQEFMLNHPSNDGFFIKTDEEAIVGTKYFYQAYHNCIGNLWLVSVAANTGLGKGNQDAIDWLSHHQRYGNLFFDSIGGLQSINTAKILYCVIGNDGTETILATKTKEWFLDQYKQELMGAGYIREHILENAKRRLAEIPRQELTHATKRNRIDLMVRIALARQLLEDSPTAPSHDSQSSSVHTSDTELNERNMNRVRSSVYVHASKIRRVSNDIYAEYKSDSRKHLPKP